MASPVSEGHGLAWPAFGVSLNSLACFRALDLPFMLGLRAKSIQFIVLFLPPRSYIWPHFSIAVLFMKRFL